MSVPGPDWTNTRLVTQCLAGDQRAWNALLERYQNLIYSIPRRYGAPHQDAADIFQAVCLDLFHELPRLRDAEAIQGWLIRVTTHKCYHWKRRLSSKESEFGDDQLENLSGVEPIPVQLLVEIEREQTVREAIAKLPPRCREMIDLLFFEQPAIPYDEVARRLNVAKGSIGFIRGRCLKRLRKTLEEKGF